MNNMKQRRKKLLARMNKMFTTLKQPEMYENFKASIDEMTDNQLLTFMKDVRDGRNQFTFVKPNMSGNPIKVDYVFDAMKQAGLAITSRIEFTDPTTGLRTLTNEDAILTRLPVRVQEQLGDKKLGVPFSDGKIDEITGQVTGNDRAASVTSPESQMMNTRGLNKTLYELKVGRGGNVALYRDMKQMGEETGKIHMDDINVDTRRRAAVMLEAYFQGMHLDGTGDLNKPMTLRILDSNAVVANAQLQPVKTQFSTDVTTGAYHADGLYSEEIFGQIATDQRLLRFGYIPLNTKILHPLIYKNLCALKRFYKDVMEGTATAVFDPVAKDLVAWKEGDPVPKGANAEVGTGYDFFIRYLPKIKFKRTKSPARMNKIKHLEIYKDNLFVDKWMVLPAGMRDLRMDDRCGSSDEINELYVKLISASFGLSGDAKGPLYDGHRFVIQNQLLAIYEYIKNILDGKKGFIAKKWLANSVALGTRNVITAPTITQAQPGDPRTHKLNEIKLPLFQAAKMFQPLVIYNLRKLFFENILEEGTSTMSVINPDTLELEYREVTESTKQEFLTSTGLTGYINRFRNEAYREADLSIPVKESKKRFLLYLVYDDGNEIYFTRSKSDFLTHYKEATGNDANPEHLRPMQHVEAIYMATHQAAKGKHVISTRFPVTDVKSTTPFKAHVCSTTVGRVVNVRALYSNEVFEMNEYPIWGAGFQQGLVIHPAFLNGFDGDYDGDTMSAIAVLTEEANEEIREYLADIRAYITPTGDPMFDIDTTLLDMLVANMTYDDGTNSKVKQQKAIQ